jgi:putative ABC transport system permease protein
MDSVAAALEKQYPKTNLNMGVKVEAPRNTMTAFYGPALFPLMGAVGFVLMIACANVTNLLLASVSTRRRELSIRVAVGATRVRLLREMLADGLALSAPGTLLGVGVAYLGLRIFNGLVRVADTTTLNAPLLLCLSAMGVLTGVIVALVPGWQASRADINEALKDGSRGTDGGGGTGLRGVLIVLEVALALILLVGAGLMIRTARSAAAIDPGFDPSHVTMMRFDLSGPRYAYQAPNRPPNIRYVDLHVDQFIEQVTAQVKQLLGVQSAGMAARAPRGKFEIVGRTFEIPGHPKTAGQPPMALVNPATADFLPTLRVPLLRGRGLSERDLENAPWVAVINETMANRYWPKQDPLGQFIRLETVDEEQPRQIVGIVKDIPQFPAEPTMPEVYTSYFQLPRVYPGNGQSTRFHPQLVVRSAEDSRRVAERVRGVIQRFDIDQAVLDPMSMQEVLKKSAPVQDLYLWSLAMFAGLALLLAAIGIYGLMSFTVSNRAHEMSIRMTLGADHKHVLWLAMSQGMRLALAGLVIGAGGALATSRLIERFLFGVKPIDPLTYAAVSGILGVVALLACYLPARRILWLDPAVALRRE